MKYNKIRSGRVILSYKGGITKPMGCSRDDPFRVGTTLVGLNYLMSQYEFDEEDNKK